MLIIWDNDLTGQKSYFLYIRQKLRPVSRRNRKLEL